MMRKNATDFFEEILNIPRASGKEEKIAGYLVHFAQKNNLEYHVDSYSNVIIKKKGTLPYKCEPIILQAHTDMVCTSEEIYDFEKKGIDWYIEKGYYKAKGTTLGADNGIGMAIILAILNDPTLDHPPIEAIFTTQEETTMDGAKFLNYKKLKGKRLISLDSSEDNKITVSCAGMASIAVELERKVVTSIFPTYELSISGLMGGHSGTDIDKGRGNAIKLMADILNSVENLELISISGGNKENVIPSTSKCLFKTSDDLSDKIDAFKIKYNNYKGIKIEFKRIEAITDAMNNVDSMKIINFIVNIEDGVLKKNEIDFPLTSSNLGVIMTTDDKIMISISIRSSIVGYEDYYISKTETLAKNNKLKYILGDRKPFFTVKDDSPLRQLLMDEYQRLFKGNVTLEDIHAGLEGGIFAGEIKGLDMCVIGVNMYDYHSINERVEIASIKKVYTWLTEVLANME